MRAGNPKLKLFTLLTVLALVPLPAWAIKFTYAPVLFYTDSTPAGTEVGINAYGDCGSGVRMLMYNGVNDGVFNVPPMETGVECNYWITATSPLADTDSPPTNLVTRTDP